MEPFAGEYRLTPAGAVAPESGACTVVVGGPGLEVTPKGGASMPVRFAEIAHWSAADHRFVLELEEGSRLELERLARRFDELVRTFRDARREHFLRALLLEEGGDAALETGTYALEDAARTTVASGAASVRLQKTSLACFPDLERPFLVPYGTVLTVEPAPSAYGIALELDDARRLVLGRFGMRTDAFARGLEERRAALARRQSDAIAALAPELGALALRRGATALRDGVPASREALEQAAPGLWDALWQLGFDETRRPYAEHLFGRARQSFVAIKETGPWGAGEGTPAALQDRRLLYLFEIERTLVVEAPSTDDAATYAFRAARPDAATAARELCRALAAVQFRREPVYLPAAALRTAPNDRYAEAARLLPELVAAREAFLGRAIHASLEGWRKELDAAAARAGS